MTGTGDGLHSLDNTHTNDDLGMVIFLDLGFTRENDVKWPQMVNAMCVVLLRSSLTRLLSKDIWNSKNRLDAINLTDAS